MPRIKRWFPVSHDINHSPTMRELGHQFGLPGWRIWFEILSIADRNGETLDCTSEGALSRLTSAAETRLKVTRKVIEALIKAHCIEVLDHQNHVTRVCNYREFHRFEESKPRPTKPDLTRPNQTEPIKIKNQKPATPEPSVDSKKSEPKKLNPAIKEIADKVYATNPIKFARLVVWIKEAEKHHFETGVIVAALERFLPYANSVASWYPYLDKLIEKCQKDFNRDQHDAQHRIFQDEARDFTNTPILSIVQGLADAKSK